MRFKQIVEELHVELIVLHDQDGLWHSVPALFVPMVALARERTQVRSRCGKMAR
jgi:hypothetical protein